MTPLPFHRSRRRMSALVRGVTLGLAMGELTTTVAAADDPARAERQRPRPRALRGLAGVEGRSRIRRPAVQGPGHVQFITGVRAYLDRGRADGLVEGQYLEMRRAGHLVGRCTVEHLADYAAACQGAGIRVGDAFRSVRSTPASSRSEPAAVPAPSDPAALDARARLLGGAPFQKVDFTPRDRDGVAPTIWVGVGAVGWSGPGLTSGTGGYVQEHIDARFERVRLGESDLRFDLAFTALRWQQRPEPSRFLPGARTEVFLWQAEVSRRELDDRTVLGAGRLWPRHVPGLPMLDGLQLGRRNEGGNTEGGVYAGTEPTDGGLVPTLARWAAGVYGVLAAARPRSQALPSAALEARIGARRAPVGGALGEAELLGQLWARSWGLGAGGRATSMPNDARPKVEFAHLHLHAGDRERIGGWLEARYLGAVSHEELSPAGEQPNRVGAYHGALGTHVDLSSAVGLGLLASAHQDRVSGARSFEGTIELRLPRLLSEAGGVSLAAAATEGWVRSRGAYLQYLGTPIGSARILAQVAARATRFDVLGALADMTELVGYLHLDTPVTTRVRFRGRSSFFVPLAVQGQSPATPKLSYQLGADAVAFF